MTIDTQRLTAGRELDAMVAEKVMGETVATFITDGEAMPFLFGDGSDLPRYSTDIREAWPLLDKISGDHHVGISGGGTIVVVRIDDSYEELVEAFADTAALAICRAALRLVEVNRCR